MKINPEPLNPFKPLAVHASVFAHMCVPVCRRVSVHVGVRVPDMTGAVSGGSAGGWDRGSPTASAAPAPRACPSRPADTATLQRWGD